jgi:hypothetical protein
VRWRLRFFTFFVALSLWSPASVHVSAQPKLSALERFLRRPDDNPTEYRALRRMEAHNEHFDAKAWMDVWTEADKSGAFRYEVASEGGSGYIRRKVLLAALESEQKLRREGNARRSQLDHTNYQFKDNGTVDGGLASLAITPKRKDVLLVDGWAFVKEDDGDLVRVEGRLSKNPSFWTRRVEIVRRYGRVGDAHVPLEIESIAQVLVAGRSTFHMTYEYEMVNGKRVGDPKPRVSDPD